MITTIVVSVIIISLITVAVYTIVDRICHCVEYCATAKYGKFEKPV